ncbi:NADAR domain-containing protein [Aphelenchoides besseyi]|nr:NADAR domain-containing protein [Aphelenchoides besseyi]
MRSPKTIPMITNLKVALLFRCIRMGFHRSSTVFHKPPVYEGRDGRQYIAFFTKKYVFSNHFVCPNGIKLEDEIFPTAEHYYMFKKAKFHGDMHVARKVRKAPDAKTAKNLVSRLKNFDRRTRLVPSELYPENSRLMP